MPNADGTATIIEVKSFFGIDNIGQFRKEWNELSETDKQQLKTGIGNGTLTY